MIVVPYRITLLEPLLATSIAGDPNSGVSYPYIPGSVVRGAVVGAYLQNKGLSTLDAGDEEAQRLFFDAQTRCLNAYPTSVDRRRCLPTPRSWFKIKGDKHSLIYDYAIQLPDDSDEDRQYESAGTAPYCIVDDEETYLIDPQRRVNVHTQRDRKLGRATDADGAVFQYDALESGQTFAGYVLVSDAQDADTFAGLLPQIYSMGGSSNSGYGRVSVEVEAAVDCTQKPWREVRSEPTSLAAEGLLVVTLLSDALVRDLQTGQYTHNLKPLLEAMLGVELVQPELEAGAVERRGVWRMEEVGGFNRTWGMPLPQAQAISAGSVFVFQVSKPISANALAAIEWQGIGERRSEGFGRIAFNWQTESELKQAEQPNPKANVAALAPALNGVAKTMAERMAGRLVRRELDARLRKRVNDLVVKASPISNAQLSRLRVIARETLADGDIDRLVNYLATARTRRSVREQFERARVANERLLYWLDARLKQPESIWETIGATGVKQQIGANVQIGVQGNDEFAREYTIRLIDGVLAKLAKQRREEEAVDHG